MSDFKWRLSRTNKWNKCKLLNNVFIERGNPKIQNQSILFEIKCITSKPVNHLPRPDNRVFHDKEIWCISVRLSDRSEVTQHKINVVKKVSPVGFELTTSGSSVWCSDNLASQESVGDVWSELSFISCTTSQVGLCLFLESIEHDFIKALMNHTDNQIVT